MIYEVFVEGHCGKLGYFLKIYIVTSHKKNIVKKSQYVAKQIMSEKYNLNSDSIIVKYYDIINFEREPSIPTFFNLK